jgi:hypothetical protein
LLPAQALLEIILRLCVLVPTMSPFWRKAVVSSRPMFLRC